MKQKYKTVAPGVMASAGTPQQCCRKAFQQVSRFRQGAQNYKRLNDKGCGYYKIDLGPFWRLLSRNKGRTWLVLSHERYNAAIRK
ncbi:hypothetical protein ABW286_20560 [Erwinia papayae]|uniref:ParE-like toxin domain-containing protein n=1 Tax=Erwinia papayae TaxID=206499 RepID=A0ABV3N6U4_9GAMM